jgi:hypothetical protein
MPERPPGTRGFRQPNSGRAHLHTGPGARLGRRPAAADPERPGRGLCGIREGFQPVAVGRGRHSRAPVGLPSGVVSRCASSGHPKSAACHSVRQWFATHLPESGCDIRTLQDLLGHRNLARTQLLTPCFPSAAALRVVRGRRNSYFGCPRRNCRAGHAETGAAGEKSVGPAINGAPTGQRRRKIFRW